VGFCPLQDDPGLHPQVASKRESTGIWHPPVGHPPGGFGQYCMLSPTKQFLPSSEQPYLAQNLVLAAPVSGILYPILCPAGSFVVVLLCPGRGCPSPPILASIKRVTPQLFLIVRSPSELFGPGTLPPPPPPPLPPPLPPPPPFPLQNCFCVRTPFGQQYKSVEKQASPQLWRGGGQPALAKAKRPKAKRSVWRILREVKNAVECGFRKLVS